MDLGVDELIERVVLQHDWTYRHGSAIAPEPRLGLHGCAHHPHVGHVLNPTKQLFEGWAEGPAGRASLPQQLPRVSSRSPRQSVPAESRPSAVLLPPLPSAVRPVVLTLEGVVTRTLSSQPRSPRTHRAARNAAKCSATKVISNRSPARR